MKHIKRAFILAGLFLTQLMFAAFAYDGGAKVPGIAFVSGGQSESSPNLYMVLTDKKDKPVSNITGRSDNLNDADVGNYEAVILCTGYETQEGDLARTILNVYQLNDEEILVVKTRACGAAGPNNPDITTYFQFYEYSQDIGFVKKLNAKLIDKFSMNENYVFAPSERLCYIDDNMVAMQELFSTLSDYGISLKEAETITSELSSSPQEYDYYLADLDDCCILSVTERDSVIPPTVYDYFGIKKVEPEKKTEKIVLENTLSDEEIAAAKEAEKERQKAAREAAKANGETMSLGEALLRFVICLVIVAFTLVSLLVVFSSPFITLAVDMVVVLIGMTLLGADRVKEFLALDMENVWILFVIFFAGIMGCCFMDWEKLAGIIYLLQMGLICLAASGVVSSEVMNRMVNSVGLYVALPAGAITVLILAVMFLPIIGFAAVLTKLLELF